METLNTRSVAEEHGLLREMSGNLLALLDGSHCACGVRGCTACIGREFEVFSRRLHLHFAEEEGSWNAIDWARGDAALRAWIADLVTQHAAFRAQLSEASRAIEAARAASKPVAGEAETLLRAILRDLVEHELSEVRLFQRSVIEGWSRSD
jgi:hypothetical protein